MPNHVTNRLEIKANPDQVKEVFQRFNTHVKAHLRTAWDDSVICNKEGGLIGWLNLKTGTFKRRDNEDVIGLPDGFELEITPAVDLFPNFNKVIPAPEDDDAYNDRPTQREAQSSPNWWRTWNCNNWGSKWGGYSYRTIESNVYEFQTAWSNCEPIIKKMSEIFPDVKFIYTYADEDFGCNVGRMIYRAGEWVEKTLPNNSTKEAYDIAFIVDPDRKKEFKLVGENYEYIED